MRAFNAQGLKHHVTLSDSQLGCSRLKPFPVVGPAGGSFSGKPRLFGFRWPEWR